MRRFKRLFYLILLNMTVSALTTLIVLNLWDRCNESVLESSTVSAGLVTPTERIIVVTATPLPDGEIILPVSSQTSFDQDQQPTPTLILTPYVVRSGDTLGSIAIAFDVSLADLLAVNNLADPDLLSIGEVIYIPAGPLPRLTNTPIPSATITPTFVPTPTRRPTTGPSPTFTATFPGDEPAMAIVGVIGVGNLTAEKVVLARTGEGSLLLLGWQLTDEDGHTYTFPHLTLYKGGVISLYTQGGQDTAVNLYWGLTMPVWESGEIVTLYDAQGKVHDVYTIP